MRSLALTRNLARNRTRQQSVVGVSLFPFLAVLICTMGALILLLVVLARQARLQAAQGATEAGQRQTDLKEAREDVQWRIEQLEISRQKTAGQLAGARLALGHVEDHARRLRDQLYRLRATLDELDRLGSDGSRQRDRLESELAQVKVEIAEAEHRLTEARQAADRRRRSHAVVPYRGPHGTYRRPIYIECRADSIVLQPEGIVLGEDDFDGPMGPGNPLAAALRAARQYLLVHGGFDPEQSGEPYPLLLVRPDGIMAYYAARGAMKSWASEFGYELIGEDWELEFQPPDPGLAEVVHRALDAARARQDRLAAAAPSHYRNPRRKEYTVSRAQRGIVPYDRSSGTGRSDVQQQQPSSTFGGRFATGGGDRPGQAPRSEGEKHEGTIADRAPKESASSTTAQGGAVMRPGQWQPDEAAGSDPSHAGESDPHVASLAKSRGRDWGLRDAANGSVPITRPVRIDCHPDRLVIVPEKGLSGGKTIPLGPRTADSIDEFISAIWEYMQAWGIAGKGMYWRPELNVHVAPDAQQRYSDLNTLLERSGLAVRKRE